MQEPRSHAPGTSTVAQRLQALRARMRERGIDAVLVRATDRYLNEYVATSESTRTWISGFTGSMGDALITGDRAILFVDGRYTLQAAKEAPGFEAITAPLGTAIESAWLSFLEQLPAQGVSTLGVETERVSANLHELLAAQARALGLTLIATTPSLIEETRAALGEAPPLSQSKKAAIWPIDAALVGRTVKERLALGHGLLVSGEGTSPALSAGRREAQPLDGLLVSALDEIAWITNLRGLHFDYQATFRARALVCAHEVIVAADAASVKPDAVVEEGVRLVGEDGLAAAVTSLSAALSPDRDGRLRIGFDPATTPEATRATLASLGCDLVKVQSPFALARTKKTPGELGHMIAAFQRADAVVSKVKSWLCSAVAKGERVTEAMVADKTAALFKRSGAFGLSFKVISAAGKNGAIIHYSTPDPDAPIEAGQIFLLDTGAYYEGGLATDLTRTFLVGGPGTSATPEQQRLFTLVLKAAIAGMSARIPVGATGEQLDALVRQPLWQAGLDYAHGTGHGVGVNVHESPPRIAVGARTPLEVGQVFSIEPGVYLPELGGVRIENLCTLVDDDVTPPAGVPRRFMRVKPLTFSPLDLRLVDRRMLTAQEKAFVKWFHEKPAGDGTDKGLPPLA